MQFMLYLAIPLHGDKLPNASLYALSCMVAYDERAVEIDGFINCIRFYYNVLPSVHQVNTMLRKAVL
jgi:hypothetical protein